MFHETESGEFNGSDFSTLTTPDLGHFFAVLHQERARCQGTVEAAGRCGCVRCHELFLPGEILEWQDIEDLPEPVACCPECGATMVVPIPASVQEPFSVLRALEKTFDTYGWDEESWT
jgi:hypothetical protein